MGTNHQFTAKELQRMNQGLPPWESLSFACGGWLQFYMFGVAKALQVSKMDQGVKYYGCSAGALTAVGLAFGAEFDDAIAFCKTYCMPKAYSHPTGLFQLAEYVTKCIESSIYPLFEKLPPGVLNVAVTRLPFFKAETISQFNSKEELKMALLASSAAFPFAPIVNHQGKWFIDGGLSDFQPVMNDETVTVSPFYFSDCDIKPSRYIPLWWSFLPPGTTDTIDWLYNLGFVDGINYLKSRGIPVKEELLNQETKVDHPYNIRKKVSVHRFLGYDMKKLTNEYISFGMDLILLFLLIIILKPIVLVLIYVELFARMFFLFSFTVLHSFWEMSPRSLLRRLIIRPYFNLLLYFTGGIVAIPRNLPAQSINMYKARMMRDLWECVLCVGSLSLLMRFFSGPPSTVVLKQHKKLAKNSICYRIFHHII